MLRFLPVIVEIGLTIFCLIDCVQAPDGAIRNLQKSWWILLILFFPIVGAVAWLVAGRPSRDAYAAHATGFPEYERDRWGAPRSGSRGSRSMAPDDDPDFLRELDRVNSEHEDTLKKWESDLSRREEELRRRERGQEPEAG